MSVVSLALCMQTPRFQSQLTASWNSTLTALTNLSVHSNRDVHIAAGNTLSACLQEVSQILLFFLTHCEWCSWVADWSPSCTACADSCAQIQQCSGWIGSCRGAHAVDRPNSVSMAPWLHQWDRRDLLGHGVVQSAWVCLTGGASDVCGRCGFKDSSTDVGPLHTAAHEASPVSKGDCRCSRGDRSSCRFHKPQLWGAGKLTHPPLEIMVE